jgi:hypothetical protein
LISAFSLTIFLSLFLLPIKDYLWAKSFRFMNYPTFTLRDHVNLRRIEFNLIARLNQLDINLETIDDIQEKLIITQDYLQQTSAPFIILSNIGFLEGYLDRQHLEMVAVTDVIRELIRIIQDLRQELRSSSST